MGVKTARMAEKGGKSSTYYNKTPPVIAARCQIPLFVTFGDIFPRPGEVFLWDGAFGIVVQFPAKVQSLRARQRLPPRGSWQNRQVLTEGVSRAPSQALPRQLSQGESQAVKPMAKVLGTKRKLPAVLLPLPLRKDFPRSGGRCRAATKGGVWQARQGLTERAHTVSPQC